MHGGVEHASVFVRIGAEHNGLGCPLVWGRLPPDHANLFACRCNFGQKPGELIRGHSNRRRNRLVVALYAPRHRLTGAFARGERDSQAGFDIALCDLPGPGDNWRVAGEVDNGGFNAH